MVNLDIREESTKHTKVICELIKNIKDKDYESLEEAQKVSLLASMLLEDEDFSKNYEKLTDDSKKVVDVFQTMILLREQVSPDAFGHYIILMTHDASHVLEVMLLAKWLDLLEKIKITNIFVIY